MVIDESLARGIRRSYLRRLQVEWRRLAVRTSKEIRRNQFLDATTAKSYRRSCEQLVKRFGKLMPSAQLRLTGGAREAFVLFGLIPEMDEAPSGAMDSLQLCAYCLLRPAKLFKAHLSVRIYGHAIDRIIQRAGVIATPVTDADMEAIQAEFADLLTFAPVALGALGGFDATEAKTLNVLLPAHHGFFLGGFEDGVLAVRTYVGSELETDSDRQALVELRSVDEGALAMHAVDIVAQGWFGGADGALHGQLLQIWRNFGWRSREESTSRRRDRVAWSNRPAPA